MHIVIDAYNLLYLLSPHISNSLKNKLLHDLLVYCKQTKQNASIVYDGGGGWHLSKEQCGEVVIVQTGTGQTADDFIIDVIKKAKHPDNLLIVTKDRAIVNVAHSAGCVVSDPEAFWQLCHKQEKNNQTVSKEYLIRYGDLEKDDEIDCLMKKYSGKVFQKNEEDIKISKKQKDSKHDRHIRRILKKL